MRIPIAIITDRTVETEALIDTGAQDSFIDYRYVRKKKLPSRDLKNPIRVHNADGTANQQGTINKCVVLEIEAGGHRHLLRLLVTSLGKEAIILGLPWLQRVNAEIDFNQGTLQINPDKVNLTLVERLRNKWFPEQDKFTGRTLHTVRTEEELKQESTNPKQDSIYAELPPPYRETEEQEQDLVLAYLSKSKGYSTEWHGDLPKPGSALTTENLEDGEGMQRPRRGPTIGRIHFAPHGTRFNYSMNLWIRAKINPAMAMAQQAHDSAPREVPTPYQEYASVFEKKAAERFPSSRPWDHAIDLKPDFIPKDFKPYRLSPQEQKVADEFIDENLKKGYIRESKSPMASPLFFVGKKDGSLRPCQDYRYLNEGTVKNAYPLPLVSELVDKLQGAKIFSKLDLRSGYNNVRIKDGDQWKAAFKTHRGLFEPMVMFFGLCNSPATFQAMMNALFKDMIDEGWLVIYMDDILIFSKDKKEHEERTRRVLERLQDNDLYLKLDKCIFDAPEVEYLGMIIRENQVAMDPVKLKGIQDWTEPKDVKGVRSFLGFGNFYRRFIDHFAEIARPLHDLTRKAAPWNWTTACQKAFDELKLRFTTAPVLLMPDISKPFYVESDASDFASGAVLRQRDTNGDLHPCAYLSKGFSPAERNYEIYDKELLGIIRALQEWRHYLLGAAHPVTVLSDHKNLTYYRQAQRLNRRQARWLLFLSEFDVQLHHVPGKDMIQSDTLSRRHDLVPDKATDNNNRVVLPEQLFVHLVDTELSTRFQAFAVKDQIFQAIHEALKTGTLPPIKSALSDWREEDGKIFFKNRCYVPADEQLRRDLIRQHHDTPAMGHPGKFKTLELLRRTYWWPGMHTMVSRFVEGCAECQQNKINTHPTVPPLAPISAEGVTRPFQQISIDYITDLPISNGYDSIMVVVDHGLTKGVIFSPCNKTIDAIGTATLLYKDVYRRFGLPDKIISDRGPQFVSHVTRELGRLLKITLSPSTAYHPQTDGQTERTNQELEVYLRIFCTGRPDTWAQHLIDAEVAHNQRMHSARNASPFYLMMGYDPALIPIAYPRTNVPLVQDRLTELQKARDEALAAHELARQVMRDRITGKFTPFKLGQKVWLEGKNLRLSYATRKLAPKREGPFEIVEVLSPLNYRLKLPITWKIHPVFHASFLTLYHENNTHGPNYTRPPPDVIDEQDEYEVEAIVGHRKKKDGIHYHIKWKGYSSGENTWEPEDSLIPHARDILNSYKKAKKLL